MISKTFGDSWGKVLEPFLKSQEFSKLARQIIYLRENSTVYPNTADTFRIFREVQINQIKVLLLGQDRIF